MVVRFLDMYIKRVLVIDSEEKFRDALVTIFHIEGFHAHGVGSFQEALKVLKKRQFSVMLVGFDDILHDDDEKILARIKRRNPGIPVVIMGDGVGLNSRVESLRRMADIFVGKPLQFEDVKRIVRFVSTVTSQES
jgi:DNA-binding NtrC family response regulator